MADQGPADDAVWRPLADDAAYSRFRLYRYRFLQVNRVFQQFFEDVQDYLSEI